MLDLSIAQPIHHGRKMVRSTRRTPVQCKCQPSLSPQSHRYQLDHPAPRRPRPATWQPEVSRRISVARCMPSVPLVAMPTMNPDSVKPFCRYSGRSATRLQKPESPVQHLSLPAAQWVGKLDAQDTDPRSRGKKLSGTCARFYHAVCDAHLARIIQVGQSDSTPRP